MGFPHRLTHLRTTVLVLMGRPLVRAAWIPGHHAPRLPLAAAEGENGPVLDRSCS
jgi:hypothetical protein